MDLKDCCHEVINTLSGDALEEAYNELQGIREHYIEVERAKLEVVTPAIPKVVKAKIVNDNDPWTDTELDVIDLHQF